MENLKIRVANESESKEVEGAFDFLLGGRNICKEYGVYDKYPRFVFGNKEFINTYAMVNWGKISNKEITLPQLRDLVVLKRNSIDDATHLNNMLSYYKACDGWYYFDVDVKRWLLSSGGKQSYYNKLKPIEKTMKEYLTKMQDGSYKLIPSKMGDEDIEVPEGMNFAHKDEFNIHFTTLEMGYRDSEVVWRRHAQPEELPTDDFEDIDAFIELNVEQFDAKHTHYKKDVSHLDILDIYRVTELFKPHSCGAHIAKKALCSGQRGHKDLLTDIQDIIDTAERWKEMLIEDSK